MDLVHDRGSMDLVHESGPWTRSKEGVHGPLVHVLSSPTKNLVAENDFDIFTDSETWLDNSITDLEVEIPGYDVYRLYRLDRHERLAVAFVHMFENLIRLNIYMTCLSFHPRAFTSCGFKYRLVAASRLLFAQYIDRLTLI